MGKFRFWEVLPPFALTSKYFPKSFWHIFLTKTSQRIIIFYVENVTLHSSSSGILSYVAQLGPKEEGMSVLQSVCKYLPFYTA
jgi:hypothetical protein